MKVQDFFSVVQLGVGIHAGTALLQLSGEFGIAPMERRINNLATWLAQEKELGRHLPIHEDDLQIVTTALFTSRASYERVYRNNLSLTFFVGILLAIVLGIMSFLADAEITFYPAISLIMLCFAPAIASSAFLWLRVNKVLRPIKEELDRLEKNISIV